MKREDFEKRKAFAGEAKPSMMRRRLDHDYTSRRMYLITLTTDLRKRDILEWFIGTQEQRIVRNSLLMPILFLNPRDDFYVLCD